MNYHTLFCSSLINKSMRDQDIRERLAVVESKLIHLASDNSALRENLRSLRDKVDYNQREILDRLNTNHNDFLDKFAEHTKEDIEKDDHLISGQQKLIDLYAQRANSNGNGTWKIWVGGFAIGTALISSIVSLVMNLIH